MIQTTVNKTPIETEILRSKIVDTYQIREFEITDEYQRNGEKFLEETDIDTFTEVIKLPVKTVIDSNGTEITGPKLETILEEMSNIKRVDIHKVKFVDSNGQKYTAIYDVTPFDKLLDQYES